MKQPFKYEYNLDQINKISTKKTNVKMFVTPRYIDHYVNNIYEPLSTNTFISNIKINNTFLDIGAHYGYYSLLAHKKEKKIKIIAIEPISSNVEILKKNFELNKIKNYKIFSSAASDKEEERTFQITKASDSSGLFGHPLLETKKIIKLKTIVPDLVLNNKKIDFIKIDVEGNELKVLNGLKKTINLNKSIKLLIEFNPKCLINAQVNPDSLIHKLFLFNFDIYLINDRTNKTHKLTKNSLWRDYLRDQDSVNLLCIPENKSKLITIFSHSSQLGGAERSMIELITELKEKNIFSHVVLPNHGPLEEKLNELNVPYDIFGLNWWAGQQILPFDDLVQNNGNVLKNLLNYLPKLSLINPDLIYSNTMVSPWGAIAANHLNKPHVWHVREYGDLDHRLKFPSSYEEIINFIGKYSDQIIVNSKSVASHLEKHLNKNKPLVAYNYIDIDSKLLKEKFNNQFKHKNSLKILVAATIHTGKNQLEALKILKKLDVKGINAELLFLGSKPNESYLKKLKKYTQENNLIKKVHFKGFVNNPYPYFLESDVVLVPSFKEAYGRTAVEGMLLKKPVVVTKEGGSNEIIDDGKTGFSYHVGDLKTLEEILIKLTSKSFREKIANQAYKSIKQINNKENYGYKIAKIIKQTIKDYQQRNKLTNIFINVFEKILKS